MQQKKHENWMIYGANGLMGNLILAEAIRRGHTPILAGRNTTKLKAIAEPLGLSHCTLTLDDPDQLRIALKSTSLVVNTAGPFTQTGQVLIKACLETKTNYLDISGEIKHLQYIESLNDAAQAAGIIILAGAGFGVTFGEILALYALEHFPDANRIRLSISPSNAQTTSAVRQTIVNVLANGGYAVENGLFLSKPLAHQKWNIYERQIVHQFAATPLGELAALHRTTKVSNIVVGHTMSAIAARFLHTISPIIEYGLAIPKIYAIAAGKSGQKPMLVKKTVNVWKSQLWAEISDSNGLSKTFHLETGEGYLATAQAVLANIEALTFSKLHGSYTPGLAFGTTLLSHLPEVKIQIIDQP